MATIASTPLDLSALRARSAGVIVGPQDASYDQARQPWNVAVDQRPAAVAFPADGQDVATVVTAARDAGLKVAVQGTGHAASYLGDLSDTVLIRTTAMTAVEIDPVARRARVGAGVLWQDVTPAASEHGLSGLAGSSPDVGIVGFSLGGGIGYLSRMHGLAANKITSIELVTAEGEQVHADASSEPDLFWAMRGGSGRFGIVTCLEFELVQVPALYAGALFWPWERSAEVLTRWRDAVAVPDAPRELTTIARILQLPPIPAVPEPLRGRQFVNVQVAFLGDAERGAELLAPLRELGPEIDMVGPMPPVGLLRMHGDPEGPSPGIVEGALLDSLPDAAIEAMVAHGGPGSGSPLVAYEMRHLGGALGEVPEGAGALGRLDGEFALHTVGVPMAPGAWDAMAAHGARIVEEMAPYGRGRQYLNFAGASVDPRDAYTPEALRRLEAVRAQVDPHGLLHTGFQPAR